MGRLKGYRVVSKYNEERLNFALAVLEAKREAIMVSILSCYKLVKNGEMSCNNLEHSGASYDNSEVMINSVYEERVQELKDCFNHIIFQGPLTILYGLEDDLDDKNFRRCIYGDSNSFCRAIRNHIESLKEITGYLPYFLTELKDQVASYIQSLESYLTLVRNVA